MSEVGARKNVDEAEKLGKDIGKYLHEFGFNMDMAPVADVLRNKLRFDGIVITDSMQMGAISKKYDSKTAVIMAINAGVDIILMPQNFDEAYEGILEAVNDGEISESRIDESLRRILKVKLSKLSY